MAGVIAQSPGSSNGADELTWKRFIDGGIQGISEAVVVPGGHRVNISWMDGHESVFSLKWLRDHSNGSFNVNTKQREIDTFAISNDTRATHATVETIPATPSSADPSMSTDNQPQQVLRLFWDADGNTQQDEGCTVPIARLRQHCSSDVARTLRQKFGTSAEVANAHPKSMLWGGALFSPTAKHDDSWFEYKALMEDDQQSSLVTSQLMDRLESHGIVIVRGVPTDLPGTEKFGRKFAGHLMSTLYGTNSWSISKETVESDTLYRNLAYTTDYLAVHTDCVFLSEPPGLQVFNCQKQAVEGGASIYVDGFAVAERLRKVRPDAFEFLTKTSLMYQSFDDGYHYIADGPVFELGPLGNVEKLRYNDHHRTPLDYLPTDDIDRFYEYQKRLIGMTRDPSMMARVVLEPGDTVVFNNHRLLHGRESYKGARRMVGCHIGMDEANSQARMQGV